MTCAWRTILDADSKGTRALKREKRAWRNPMPGSARERSSASRISSMGRSNRSIGSLNHRFICPETAVEKRIGAAGLIETLQRLCPDAPLDGGVGLGWSLGEETDSLPGASGKLLSLQSAIGEADRNGALCRAVLPRRRKALGCP